jgi:hypothetical protein
MTSPHINYFWAQRKLSYVICTPNILINISLKLDIEVGVVIEQ